MPIKILTGGTVERGASVADEQIGLEEAVEQAVTQPRRWPRFAPVLEALFIRDSHLERSRLRFMLGFLGIGIYDFFFITDCLMIPEIWLRAAIVRFAVMTPIGIAAMFGARGASTRIQQEIPLAVVGLLYGFSLLYLFRMSSQQDMVYSIGYVLLPIFFNLLLPLLFSVALVTSAVSALVFAAVIWTAPANALPPRLVDIAVVECAILMTLVANYRIEQYRRTIYASNLREQLRAQRLAMQNRRLYDLSNLDGLTGLANRRHLDTAGPEFWLRAEMTSGPLAVLMLDVDHFKRFNDRLGHPAGDACLLAVANILREHVRHGIDLMARYGGEEFCVVMPDLDRDGGWQVADRLCRAIAASAIGVGEGLPPERISVSIGLAVCRPASKGVGPTRWWPEGAPQDWPGMLAAADKALYAAKQSGRNRVCTAPAKSALLPDPV